jgi:polyhydroxyalkanoate synthesis regulator phasin
MGYSRKLTLSLFAVALSSTAGFAPRQLPASPTSTLVLNEAAKHQEQHHVLKKEHHHRVMDEIAEELEELAQKEIKPTILKEAKGVEGYYHESLVHKLRRTIHEHDIHYRHEIEVLQTTLDRLEKRLERTERLLDEERDKTVGIKVKEAVQSRRQRFKNFVGNGVNKVLKFLHLYRGE